MTESVNDSVPNLQVRSYLLEKEDELTQFEHRVYKARERNRVVLKEHRLMPPAVSPEEEKFKFLYNQDKARIAEMSDHDLIVLRQELAEVSRVARVRIAIIDDVKEERKRKNPLKSVYNPLHETDESTNAINNIKKAKLTKAEKIRENFRKMGLSEDVIQSMMSAGHKAGMESLKKDDTPVTETKVEQTSETIGEAEAEETKPVYNPLKKFIAS